MGLLGLWRMLVYLVGLYMSGMQVLIGKCRNCDVLKRFVSWVYLDCDVSWDFEIFLCVVK